MWDDDYREEQDEIKASEFLKVKTLQKMKESGRNSSNIFRMRPVLGLGIAASFLVVLFAVLNWPTILDDGSLMTDLVFERLDGGSRHFGIVNDAEGVTLAEVELELAVSISDLDLSGFYLENVSWRRDGDDVRIHYLFEGSDATIWLMLNNHTDSVLTNSVLNGFSLGLYYQVMLLDTTFIAEFLHNGLYYQIEVVGLTEEAFVDYLSKIINFLN